jgi:hypothetical protein
MGLRRELRDPWGLLVGAIAGGLGWAVGAPAAAAAAIGVAVYGAKVLAGTTLGRTANTAGTPSIRPGSVEAAWVRRAEQAVRSMEQLGASVPPGPVAERMASIGDQATGTLEDVRRLAVQASGMDDALAQVDPARLIAEADRLDLQLRRASTKEVHDEVERSRQSIGAQMDVRTRLEQASEKLLARIEAVVLGLESLVARLVEIQAMVRTQSPVDAAGQVDALAEELEGLRAGLAETEEVSRRALVAYRGASGAGDAGGGKG